LATGCISQEEKAKRDAAAAAQAAEEKAANEKAAADHREKINLLKTRKILNIRETDTSVDFILEDGTIITIYSYQMWTRRANHNDYYHHLGVK
jgi:DNA-binding LytR/AlgR family response regulator